MRRFASTLILALTTLVAANFAFAGSDYGTGQATANVAAQPATNTGDLALATNCGSRKPRNA